MKKILVIDDDNAVRETTVRVLRRKGFEVLEAADGQMGLELAVHQLPDLVLSDIMMAGVDGFGVLQSLRSQPATSAIPVVLMTGVPGEQNMRSGMELGADDFLAKPFSATTLCQAVQARLGRQETIQQQAKEQEGLMLEILSATQDLVAITNAADGRLLYLNAAGKRLLNIGETEDIEGLHFDDFQVSTGNTTMLHRNDPRSRTQNVWTGEGTLVSQDGREIPVSKQILAHYAPDGQIAYLSVVASDVTERRQMELALAESKHFLDRIINAVANPIFVKDRHHRGVLVNDAYCHFLGCRREELIGKSDLDFFPKNEVDEFWSKDELVFKTGKENLNEEKFTDTSGNVHTIVTQKTLYTDKQGAQFLVGVIQDITDRKLAEEALARDRTLLRTLIDNLRDVIYVKDTAGRKILSNPADVQIARRQTEAEVIGKTDFDFFPREIAGKFHADDQKVLQGEAVINREEYFFDEKGQKRWLLTSKLPLRGQNGEIIGLVGIGRDITERKQAEETVAGQQRLLNNLITAIPDLIYFKDRESRFIRINEAYAKRAGLPDVDAATGKTDFDIFGERHARKAYEDEQRILATGQPIINMEEQESWPNGRVTWVTSTKMPLFDGQGKIVGTMGVSHDITERKRAEEKLRLQTSALEAADHGILITDRDAKILWCNAAFTRLTGFSAAEVAGKTPAIQKSNRQDGQFYARLWQTILAGDVWRSELINHRKDGTEYFEELTITPVRDADGEIRHFIAIKQDISQRKHDEAKLRAREGAFRTLADNVPDAVARIDRNLCFVYGNRAFSKDVGKAPSAFIGKSGNELNLPCAEQWEKELHHVFETSQARSFEFQWPGPEGICYRESRLVPERSSTGVVEFVLAMTRDVTEQKRAEKERQMMELHLRQAQKMEAIGQLAAGIAHEINTPTQYVGDNTRFLKDAFGGLLSLLNNHGKLVTAARENALTPEIVQQAEDALKASDLDYLTEQIPQAIQETLEGVERVTKIVRAMKDFSHPGGKEKSPADLNKAIESTTTVARNEWKYVSDLKLDLAPDLPLVPCFIGEFNQVILNLIVNAAHAIGDVVKKNPGTKGLITVQTRRDGDHTEIRVSDTGTGIAEIHRAHIFEPFFTTKDVGRGTGQGLALIYNTIVKKHGGTVTFETEVGKGATFIVRLPIHPSNPATEKSPVAGPTKTFPVA